MKNFTVSQVNATYVANEMVNYFMVYAKGTNEVDGVHTMYVGNSAVESEGSKYRVKCSYFTNNSVTYVAVEWSLKSNNRYIHSFTTKREFNKFLLSLKEDEVRDMIKECITEGFGRILEQEAISTLYSIPNNSIEVDEQGNTFASPIAFKVHPYALGKYHLNEVFTFWVVPQENTISLGGVTISYDKSRAYKEFNIIMEDIISAWYENEVKEVKESFNTPNDAEVVTEWTEIIKDIKNNCSDIYYLKDISNGEYACIDTISDRLDYCTVRLVEHPRYGWVLDINPRFEDDKQGGWCVPLMYDTDVIINKIVWIENSYRLSKAMFVHNYDMAVAYNEVISKTKVAYSIEQLDDILTMVNHK